MLIGPAHSGKSELALRALAPHRKTGIIGMASPLSPDLTERIGYLQSLHPASASCFEEVGSLSALLAEMLASGYEQILVDSFNQWLSREIVSLSSRYDLEQIRSILDKEFALLMGVLKRLHDQPQVRLIMVTSEISAGIVPPGEPTRIFRQLNGILSQRLAQLAKAVLQVSCGIPFVIKYEES
jgi:adenosylcobinamide kinase/adenosylcobinamide-phosphate guanylyltransferase